MVCEVMALLFALGRRHKCAHSLEEIQTDGPFHVLAFHKEATMRDTYAHGVMKTGTHVAI